MYSNKNFSWLDYLNILIHVIFNILECEIIKCNLVFFFECKVTKLNKYLKILLRWPLKNFMCIIESTFVCYLTSLLISGRCSVIQSTKCQQKGNWLAEMCYPVKWVFSRFLVNWMIVLYPVKMVSFCENWYKIKFLRLICKNIDCKTEYIRTYCAKLNTRLSHQRSFNYL